MSQQKRSLKAGAELQEMLDRLDRAGLQSTMLNRRAAPRTHFRKPDLEVEITQPGGGTIVGIVPAHDLSSGGVSFIYWGFLHKGTPMKVVLHRHDGSPEKIPGVVRWCQYLGHGYHLIGVAFRERIFTKLYLPESAATDGNAAVVGQSQDAKARILLVGDQEMDRLLFVHQLRDSSFEAHAVGTVAEATAMIGLTPFEIILCDLNLADMTGEDAIRKLRAAGFKGPIIVLTAENSPARWQAARAAGAQTILEKPCPPHALHAVLTEHLAGSAKPDEPIFSTLPLNATSEAMIFCYVETIRVLSKEIQEAANAQDLPQLRKICQTLKGSGDGYGFPLLSAVAHDAVSMLDLSANIADARAAIDHLLNVCRRLTPGKPEA